MTDERNAIMAEALALGGRQFVLEVAMRATDAADDECDWHRVGDEPPDHREAWCNVARRLVDERRAAVAMGAAPDTPS